MAWMLILLAAALYCAVRALFDLRRRQYLLAALGLAIAGALMTMPVSTHAVKIDLPQP